jgi:uncharacterized membrane protein YccC
VTDHPSADTASARSNPLRALVELEPGKPAIAAGLRMMVTVVGPVATGMATGHLAFGLMSAVAALNVGLTDDGGPYGQRLSRMCVATVGLAVSVFAATLAGSRLWIAVPLTLVWTFACGLTNLFGNGAATAGMVTLVAFAVGLGLPGDLGVAGDRFLQFLAGGAWSVVMSNVLWPLHPWKPIERAGAAAYRALRSALGATFERDRSSPGDAVTSAVATALDALVAHRAGRRGPAPRAEQLLFLLRIAEQADQTLLTIREIGSTQEGMPFDPGEDWTRALGSMVSALDTAVAALAAAVEAGGGDVSLAALETAVAELDGCFDAVRLRATTPAAVAAMSTCWDTKRLLVTLGDLLKDAADTCRALAEGRVRPSMDASALAAAGPGPLTVIRENLTLRSAGLRHALRLAVTTAAAVVVGGATALGHSYWITLTVVVIMKPTFGATIERGLQRVVGTVLGALFAAMLTGFVGHDIAMLAILAALSVLTFSLLPLNYGLYALFLTPLVILLLELGQPRTLSAALDRAGDTLVGGGLALVGGYLLWPTSERLHLPHTLGEVAGAVRVFVRATLDAYLGAPNEPALRTAAGRATLTVGNAEAALQRLMTEPRRRRGDVACVLAFVGAAHRLRLEASALAVHAAHLGGAGTLEGLAPLAGQIDAALAGVEAAVRGGQRPTSPVGLDAALRPMRDQVAGLYARRAAELGARQTRTPTRELLSDVALAAREIARLAGDVAALHAAAIRVATSASTGRAA